MGLAQCMICKQQFKVAETLFYDMRIYNGQLIKVKSSRAFFYHKKNDKYCLSNGVVK